MVKSELGPFAAEIEAKIASLLAPSRASPPTAVPIIAAAQTASERLQSQFHEKQLRWSIELESPFCVETHGTILTEIIEGMFLGAIERADEGTEVTCVQSRGTNAIILAVASFGPIVPSDKTLDLFWVFGAGQGNSREALYVARSVAQQCGFEISYRQQEVPDASQGTGRCWHRFELLMPPRCISGADNSRR